ncbi:hypothetical protein ACS127_07050 [Amphibacillus sp. Q70]|uniref:hypothetical protein n=1 Tax=Amphibacillus sp. Q70 TaxID=3453416 RepID=UPI003F872064
MLKQKGIYLLLIAVIGLLLVFSLILRFSDFRMSNFFGEKEEELEVIDSNAILVEGEDFNVTAEEFLDYKENLCLVHQLNSIKMDISDEEILNRIIENKLLLQFADEQGVTVAESDVLNYAEQTKEAFEKDVSPELSELYISLAEELDVSPEEYFTHPEVLQQYEEVVKANKLIEIMTLNGEINESVSIEQFKSNLKDEKANTFEVRQGMLDQLAE